MHAELSFNSLWSKDLKFGVDFKSPACLKIRRSCQRDFPMETGGILVGSYNDSFNCAQIERASGPPLDSKQTPVFFKRGIRRLNRWLDMLWEKNRQYYLGEWHFHPNGRPNPSGQDLSQMAAISSNNRIRCPEPILLIVGGRPDRSFSHRAFVFPAKGRRVELF